MAGKKQIWGAALGLFFLVLPAGAYAQSQGSEPFVLSDRCLACHNGLITPSGENVSIGADWQSSIMAHASRDPYWQAAVRREVLDHPGAREQIEDECSICHMPMTNYEARLQGRSGSVFAHLPIAAPRGRGGRLAADAVSCSTCHQIEARQLGTEASFTGGFVIDTQSSPEERPAYGPYRIDPGRKATMQSAALRVPSQGRHIQQAELCASCHTLYTHTRGAKGEVIGELPEQVPYLEWLHSDYRDTQSCQDCHMPRLEHPMALSSILPQERQGFSQHLFRGGNFFLPRILSRYRAELGIAALPQDLARTAAETTRHLQRASALLQIGELTAAGEVLQIPLTLTNLAGHKLPTAYPSRRAWIHLKVSDNQGRTLLESGALRPDGSIAANDNDRDPRRYEPHYRQIDSPEQVQIYEAIMEDADGRVTTGLISALRFVKDNRILPSGFNKNEAPEDIAVQGEARGDRNFQGGGDRILYLVDLTGREGPFDVQAELWYQPIAFRWAHNLASYEAMEPQRFVGYYEEMAQASSVVLAEDQKRVEKSD